jgi:multiple sugar transport system substrate-binding protein
MRKVAGSGVSRRAALIGIAGTGATLAFPAIVGAQSADRYAKFRGTTVVVNVPAHPHYDVAMQLVPEFTKQTGIKVEIDKMQYLRMHDKQVLEMAKPQGDYDVISYVVMWKTEYVAKKFLVPLEPFLANAALADPGYDLRDIVKSYYENIGLVGGPKGYLPGPGARLYGIPFGSETSVLAYRKDILEKHGIAPPATYEELLRACSIIKEKERMGGLTSRGQAGHQVTAAWLFHLTPYGGEVFDASWNPAFHKEPSLNALKALKHIVDTGPAGIPSFGFGEMLNAFLQGEAAMYLDATAVFGPARNPQASKIVGKVGYAIHPKAVTYSGETGGFGLAIPNNSRNKEAAFLFIEWFTSKTADRIITSRGARRCAPRQSTTPR